MDAASRHHLLRKFHPLLSAPKQAKDSKDPSSSLKVELQSLAAAGGSCLLSLAWLCSLNTSLLGRHDRLEHLGVTEEDFKIYHSALLTLLLLQEGLRVK